MATLNLHLAACHLPQMAEQHGAPANLLEMWIERLIQVSSQRTLLKPIASAAVALITQLLQPLCCCRMCWVDGAAV